MTFITVKEASEKWNIGSRRICILCSEGRIPGAVKKSKVWMIPDNAQKPEDGRSMSGDYEVDPLLLYFNPTYFETHTVSPRCETGRAICEIQNEFYKGNLDNAYADICRLLEKTSDERYRLLMLSIKSLIAADMGKKSDFMIATAEIYKRCKDNNSIETQGIMYYIGQIPFMSADVLSSASFSNQKELFSLMSARRYINELLLVQNNNSDTTSLEIACRSIDPMDYPLICAYFHLYLALYYNASNMKELYEYHIRSVTDILLPRGWFMPFVEYSATLDLSIIKDIDLLFYKKVMEQKQNVLIGYSSINVFSGIADKPRKDMSTNIKVGYLIMKGKNNDEIANELGISKYMVKQHIEDLYTIAGVSSRKEIIEFIQKNLQL